MSPEEKRLARMWFHEDGETADEIAERLRRDPTAIRRFLKHGQIEASRNGRAQVGMSSSAPNIRGGPETHFWRECIHILPKVWFCTVDGQWTDSGRYSGR